MEKLKENLPTPCPNKIAGWFYKTFVYSSLFRFALESAIDMQFGLLMELSYIDYSQNYVDFKPSPGRKLQEIHPASAFNYVSTSLGVVSAVCYAILPIYIYFKIVKRANNPDLHNIKFKKKYGGLYETLRTSRKGALAFNAIFIMRRWILAASVVYFTWNNTMCLVFFVVC